MSDNLSEELALHLYRLHLTPLYVVLSALVWVIHDYFITLEDEVTYFWSRRPGFGGLIFFWIRYYTIFLVVFDTIDTHIMANPGFSIYSLILGAISLWSIEIFMQLRIYILFNHSKRIAFVNGVLFIVSIGLFLWILIEITLHQIPFPENVQQQLWSNKWPSLMNDDRRWFQWVPATLFEFVLFGMAVYKIIVSSSATIKFNGRRSLVAILLHGNIVYFFLVACVLVLNNLMVVCKTNIPWFGFGPFHGALGIVTCRMLIHLRKFAAENLEVQIDSPSQEVVRSQELTRQSLNTTNADASSPLP